MQRVDLVHAVLGEHLAYDGLGAVPDRQQQRFVRHVPAQTLAVDLERSAGVRAAVPRPELLQLFLELLLAPSSHHGFRVGNGPRERRFRQFCVGELK